MTKLEFLRRSRGWSQDDLARHLGPGFSGSTVSLIETGRLRPSPRQEARLARAFGVPVAELLAAASDPTVDRVSPPVAVP